MGKDSYQGEGSIAGEGQRGQAGLCGVYSTPTDRRCEEATADEAIWVWGAPSRLPRPPLAGSQ
jgi:hypothetical protein